MTARVLIACALTGLAVRCLCLLVVHPTRRLGPRIAPYAQRDRLRMGQGADPSLLFGPATDDPRSGIFSPIVAEAARRLATLTDAGGPETLALRLRHAGYREMTVEQYRLRQLSYAARGMAAFVVAGVLTAPNAGGVLVAVALGAVWGVSRCRARIDRDTARRRELMRAELATIAQLLAIHIRAGTAPMVAIESVAGRSGGAVADDLIDALNWTRDGTAAAVAFEHLATVTAEPAAARLYRILATSDIGDGEMLAVAFLATARDLRIQQGEAIERLAVRRRFQMLIPTIAVMGPVMLLFLAAPIPTFFFGGR